MLRVGIVALGVSVSTDAHACRRLFLPVAQHGGGLRRQADSALAEVWGAAWRVVPHLLDTLAPDGTVLMQGILDRPAIAARVGRGAFEDMPTQGWRQFFASGSRLGGELEAAWSRMQTELAGWGQQQDGMEVALGRESGLFLSLLPRGLGDFSPCHATVGMPFCLGWLSGRTSCPPAARSSQRCARPS